MGHDPLCPMPPSKFMAASCRCDLIAEVEGRERARIRAGVEALATRSGWFAYSPEYVKRSALAVIAAAPQHVGPCSGMGGPFGCKCDEGTAAPQDDDEPPQGPIQTVPTMFPGRQPVIDAAPQEPTCP